QPGDRWREIHDGDGPPQRSRFEAGAAGDEHAVRSMLAGSAVAILAFDDADLVRAQPHLSVPGPADGRGAQREVVAPDDEYIRYVVQILPAIQVARAHDVADSALAGFEVPDVQQIVLQLLAQRVRLRARLHHPAGLAPDEIEPDAADGKVVLHEKALSLRGVELRRRQPRRLIDPAPKPISHGLEELPRTLRYLLPTPRQERIEPIHRRRRWNGGLGGHRDVPPDENLVEEELGAPRRSHAVAGQDDHRRVGADGGQELANRGIEGPVHAL